MYGSAVDGNAFVPEVLGTSVFTPPPSGTLSVSVAVCVSDPDVPLSNSVNGPGPVEDVTLRVSGLVLPAEIFTGEAMIPLGWLVTETETVPVNTLKGVTETWMSPEFPRLTASEVGEAESLKSCPVPVNFISIGLNEPPVYANVLTPLIEPAAAGVNVTLRVHVADPARLAPHGLVPLGTALY